jgi:phosphatidylglycerophosphate synthase
MATNTYREATRIQTSVLAGLEKRVLIWIAERLPARVNSDHLTVLAGLAMAGGGICYWIGPRYPVAMFAAIGMLVLNWFGDSLDGTVARVRHHERPRYGFYVDHVLDVIGILMLLAGFALGGFMTPLIAAGFLIAYYLLMVEIALATHAVGTFRISFWKFGPTELRILLAIGTLRLIASPYVTVAGHRLLLFDVGGIVAITALLLTFLVSAVANTRHLFLLEPLPQRVESPDDSRRRGRSALLVKDPDDSKTVGRRSHVRSHA